MRQETRAFVQSILSMAHNLHMKVIVEGIENREQLELMQALGTNEAQGYLLGTSLRGSRGSTSPGPDCGRTPIRI